MSNRPSDGTLALLAAGGLVGAALYYASVRTNPSSKQSADKGLSINAPSHHLNLHHRTSSRAEGATAAMSPRSPGALTSGAGPAEHSGDPGEMVTASGSGQKGEVDPWVALTGKDMHLGTTRELPNAGIDKVLLLEVPRLQDIAPAHNTSTPNVRHHADWSGQATHTPYISTVSEDSFILGDIVRSPAKQKPVSRAFVRAGVRAQTYFDPSQVRAAIVTCGGLCPGLNNVIRECVDTLVFSYGVETIYGVQHGYWGFHTPDADLAPVRSPNAPKDEPPLLTPAYVAKVHNYGGTVLGSDRGGHDVDVILRFCATRGVNQLYIIGGDGTHRGAHAIYQEAAKRGIPMAVAAIPKTIDNDVDIIDRSFGFDSAYSEAQRAIKTAKTEAAGAPNGIGIVKVMGRYAGFIAAYATLASGDVDCVLVPELPIALEGPGSILEHLRRVVAAQGHAVVVVAEGAGEDEMHEETLAAGGKVEFDAGGNRKLPPVGPWLQNKIAGHFASVGVKATIKYIDPSYMVRSVPATPPDSIYCTYLAQSAVHGAMAGYTGFSVGLVNNRLVYLPITAITANSPRRMNPRGRTVERLLQLTRMPDPLADPELRAKWEARRAAAGISSKGGD